MRPVLPAGIGLAGCVLLVFATSPSLPAATSAGERAFQKCYACHSLEGLDPDTQGPSLKGIIGRKIAAQATFRYSLPMRAYAAKQRNWSRAALDAFIADPQRVVPDNEMGFFGMPDQAERKALIDFLNSGGR